MPSGGQKTSDLINLRLFPRPMRSRHFIVNSQSFFDNWTTALFFFHQLRCTRVACSDWLQQICKRVHEKRAPWWQVTLLFWLISCGRVSEKSNSISSKRLIGLLSNLQQSFLSSFLVWCSFLCRVSSVPVFGEIESTKCWQNFPCGPRFLGMFTPVSRYHVAR